MALGDNLAKCTNNTRLNFGIHGQVGFIPLPHHAQADEIGFLTGNLLGGVVATGLAEGLVIHLHAGFANLLLYLVLDRQTMTVPARHVRRIIAHEAAGLDDHVLENLVDRVTNVNAAVGVRRAIMKDELFPPFTLLAQVAVDVEILPALEHFRLALGQVAAHGEGGFRQIQGVLVVAHGLCAYSFGLGQFESVIYSLERSRAFQSALFTEPFSAIHARARSKSRAI